MHTNLTQEELKESLSYDPLTGIFTRLISNSNRTKVGDIAGTLNKLTNYRLITIKNVKYLAHRLAWLYVYGVWPTKFIDHHNGIRDDNRLFNLREATHQQNNRNKNIQKNNSSGIIGVCWAKHANKWKAQCKGLSDGIPQHLGYFDTKEEASEVREKFAKEHFGEFYKE